MEPDNNVNVHTGPRGVLKCITCVSMQKKNQTHLGLWYAPFLPKTRK